jgi:hypothetical protein
MIAGTLNADEKPTAEESVWAILSLPTVRVEATPEQLLRSDRRTTDFAIQSSPCAYSAI